MRRGSVQELRLACFNIEAQAAPLSLLTALADGPLAALNLCGD